jgi:hypothetical protein
MSITKDMKRHLSCPKIMKESLTPNLAFPDISVECSLPELYFEIGSTGYQGEMTQVKGTSSPSGRG